MANNNFSFRRVGLLLNTEFRADRKNWIFISAGYLLMLALIASAYFWGNEKSNYAEIMSNLSLTLAYICIIVSIFVAKMGLKSYTNENNVIVSLLTPASKFEKYLTAIIRSVIIPLFILVSLPIIVYNLIHQDEYMLYNVEFYMMLMTMMFVMNFMHKGYLRFIIGAILTIFFFFVFRNMRSNYYDLHLEILSLIFIGISGIALIASWKLFKNHTIE